MNSQQNLSQINLVVPKLPATLLSRPRLLEHLSHLIDRHKMTILTAPAGYGKTTLLSDFAHQTAKPVCWYTITSLDASNPRRFIAHFTAALGVQFPQLRLSPLAKSNTLHHLPEQTAVILAGKIGDAIRDSFILVLDDYHLIDGNREIGAFVGQFAQQVEETCRLVLAARSLVALPGLPNLAARDQVGGLGLQELSFTPEEIQSLWWKRHRRYISNSDVETLHKQSGGWVMALLLASYQNGAARGYNASQTRQVVWAAAPPPGSNLYDYLAQQVLDREPEDIRTFLLRSSCLEEFNASLCEAVLGGLYAEKQNWFDLMVTIYTRNLFVQPTGRGWLRYHDLFRKFLQTKLEQTAPGEKQTILYRLAAAYAAQEKWEKACNVYLQLRDIQAAADLIEKEAGMALIGAMQYETLAQLLQKLPARVVNSRPVLLALQGAAYMEQPGKTRRSLAVLRQARETLHQTANWMYLGYVIGWLSAVYRLLGNYEAALTCADDLAALCEKHKGEAPEWESRQAYALRAKGLALGRLGLVGDAVTTLKQSLAKYEALDNRQKVALLSSELGVVYVETGAYQRAEVAYRRAMTAWPAESLFEKSVMLNNFGYLLGLTGKYEDAIAVLDEALAVAEQSGNVRAYALARASVGDMFLELEGYDAALENYRRAREQALMIDYWFLIFYLDVAEARVARLQGDPDRAGELLEQACLFAQASKSRYEQALCHLEMGRLARERGDTGQAARYFKQTQQDDNKGSPVELAAWIELAATHHQAGDIARAAQAMAQVFRLSALLKHHHPLAAAGREIKPLLEILSEANSQAADLLAQVNRLEKDIAACRRDFRRRLSRLTPFNAPPQLAVTAFGEGTVKLNGKAVDDPNWRNQRRVRSMFFFLLHHKRSSKSVLLSAFWADRDAGERQLKNTMYRLRQSVGKDVILYRGGQYHFNDMTVDYRYDVEDFKWYLGRAGQKGHDLETRISLYQNALSLYKADFLTGQTDDLWVLGVREELKRRYIEAALELGLCYIEKEMYNEALQCCRRVFKVADRVVEEAHRLAMLAFAAKGEQAEVMRQYQACIKALQREGGLAPSEETRALYEDLARLTNL